MDSRLEARSALGRARAGTEELPAPIPAWATDPVVARTSFRMREHPLRRRIFAGFRCARDAG